MRSSVGFQACSGVLVCERGAIDDFAHMSFGKRAAAKPEEAHGLALLNLDDGPEECIAHLHSALVLFGQK